MAQSETFTIARRYCGPDASGNGGYVCGVLASGIVGEAEVTLKAPPPLETPLRLERLDQSARLFDGATEIASARAATLDLTPPPLIAPRDAEAASRLYAGFAAHPYPNCFVCGPKRAMGDGLRIFPGPCGAECVATLWSPLAADCDESGAARPEIVWAALDCPGYFGLRRPDLTALLGRMTAQIFARPHLGETCVVMGWRVGQDGRKHSAGAALYGASGALLGLAKTVWIALPSASVA